LGDDVLSGAFGLDIVSYFPSPGSVRVSLHRTGVQNTGAGRDLLSDFEGLWGSGFSDRLTGNNRGNDLRGFSGDDTIRGGGGNDTIAGGSGFDVLRGGGGDDLIKDEPPAVSSIGPATIIGGAGADALWDRIADQVIFVYEKLSDSTLRDPDRLVIYGSQFDFDADKIDLSLIDADVTAAGDQAFVQVQGEFTGHAGELRLKVVQAAGGARDTQVLLDVDGDAKADGKIVLAGNHPTFDDFIL
jgi:Ca2+-binding RTX toxin-like protein